jgi:outer membrane protein TolC
VTTIRSIAGVLALGAALAPAARAQESADTLRLAAVVAEARTANPTLMAMRLTADAATYRPSRAGAWPDPTLSVGLMNRPLDGFGTGQMMTMNTVTLTQRIPWPGKRGFDADQFRALAEAKQLDADEAERQLTARVVGVFADIAAIDRRLVIMLRTRDLLRDFADVSRARYGVGETIQQDVLQAEVAVARMREDILVLEQERIALAARLNALLGRAATAPIGPVELPAPAEEIPEADSLMTLAAAHRPALLAAEERVRAADAGYRQARRELYPDFMISVGYGQRPEYVDMMSIMVGVTIPLWAGSRQLPLRDEMAAMRAAEEAAALDLANETFAALAELRAEAERARRLSVLYRTDVLPQARAAVEAALSAYRVGTIDYMTLVESEMTVNRYETELIQLHARWLRATAEIDALAGDTGGDQ